MQVNRLEQWLSPFKATVEGQSLCALENRPEISASASLCVNSQQLKAGDVFLAIAGVSGHGNKFIETALLQGAALVLTNELLPSQAQLLQDPRVLLWSDVTAQLPALISSFYQHSAAKLELVGITGTNGKSSTAIFVNQLSRLLGEKAAVIGTLGYGEFPAFTPLQNTTPHLVDLHRIFKGFADSGCKVAAMEVSSHALVQQRVAGLKFAVAVYTNLSRDHLDYHGSMHDYFTAKALLFTPELAKAAVINVSDDYGKILAAQTALPALVYGKLADCKGFTRYLAYDDLACDGHGFRCTLHSHLGQYQLVIPLLAEFNVQNVLAAMGALLLLGHALPDVVDAVARLLPVPGRMEQWHFPEEVTLVVDYAHTPDALQQSLVALRQQCRGHLWCVFGCGGDRDKGKRPLMGQIAEQYADHVIITADNPRTEAVLDICNDIAAGMVTGANCQIETDRESAIKLALIEAHQGDMILVAGKGHEAYQIIGSTVRDYDERKFISSLLAEMSR
ncbi:UDP-N-acetylmuramoyl-L-alanyl-D-glutamate--2,6-diaminopimelate ligase [Rheinheimera sp.]|uniref:UDP-N-acetylmuramoyl-L-alanyl-D-glutamate--2, 6-diaminopimelate ligase n=1 Tax=Rheinheimera sp. TaxID=1869214 RepID=UPI0027BA1F84|nr:UDP-N-acetylmuramoyl-L-alanyl-D-glutamate--2,6-diaminopimelate ligase [Rheinheimera sp.]